MPKEQSMRVIPSLALLAISSVTLFKLPAVADTYQILALANDDLVSEIYGIDDNKVVLEAPAGAFFCGPDSTGTCYLTFVNGIDVSNSVIPPLLSPNMGGPMGPGCAPLPVDAVVSAYLCVNGHEAYIGAFRHLQDSHAAPTEYSMDPILSRISSLGEFRFLTSNSSPRIRLAISSGTIRSGKTPLKR